VAPLSHPVGLSTWLSFGVFLGMLVNSHLALPRALAKSIAQLKSCDARVAADGEGFTVSLAGNVGTIPWSRLRDLWLGDEFIVLGLSFFRMLHIPTRSMTAEVRAEFEQHASRTLGA
jgi:hypothetical protein